MGRYLKRAAIADAYLLLDWFAQPLSRHIGGHYFEYGPEAILRLRESAAPQHIIDISGAETAGLQTWGGIAAPF